MATHRSLNKLEFKAHMSIHNFVEVPEGEQHEAKAFTRDRWGKKHLLVDESGDSRVGDLRKKALILAFVFALMGSASAFAEGITSEHEYVKKKGPNTQISSGDAEVHLISRWMNEGDPKPDLYQNGSMAASFNDNGDPNVSTRF